MPDDEHGSEAGYARHRRNHEAVCQDCREAHNDYTRSQRRRDEWAGYNESPKRSGMPTYAGWYATDGFGEAIAELSPEGAWSPVASGIRCIMTVGGNPYDR